MQIKSYYIINIFYLNNFNQIHNILSKKNNLFGFLYKNKIIIKIPTNKRLEQQTCF